MEVPAITAGVLAEIRVPAGEVAPVGAVVAVIADGAGAAASAPPAAAPASAAPASSRTSPPPRAAEPAPSADKQPAAPPAAPIALDPFFEVRTPARNFGPARLPGGTRVTPLARRLAGGSRHRSRRYLALGPAWPHRRARRRGRAARADEPGAGRVPRLLPSGGGRRAPTRSRRSTATCRSRKCRSTACAGPSPRG